MIATTGGAHSSPLLFIWEMIIMTLTFYQILCLLAVPTFFGGIYGLMFKSLEKKQKRHEEELERNGKETKAVMLGVQALLRSQMINDYNKWAEHGYAPIYARENFENCWVQYHALGANGVMDDVHAKFVSLPIEPPEEE